MHRLFFRLRWPLALTLVAAGAVSRLGHSAPTRFIPIGLTDANAAPKTTVSKSGVTYTKDIAPILYENCTSCHREGEVAPFALKSYSDAQKRAHQLAIVTSEGIMPPWKADEGKEKFASAHVLTPEQITTIKQWADAGAPEGNKADLPAMPQFPAGWQNGTPDVVLQPSEAYTLAAEGDDIYKCFVIPTNYDEDRYVAAMEVRPGNRPVVHHVIAYLDTSGQARAKDAAEPGPGYTSFGGIGVTPAGMLGGWAPGMVPKLAAAGSGILLPKGADVVLQVHYHRSGKPETDLTKIGLFFAKGPIDKRIRSLWVINPGIQIPAGEANYTTTAARTVPQDITVVSVTPHMHLLGKQMTVNAVLPDGTSEKLVNVKDWDFNWQMVYAFNQPVKLPAGTKVQLSATYDNSANNPVNPTNPPRNVTWGEQTTDEMCLAFLNYTVDKEHLTQGQPATASPGAGADNGPRRALLQRALEVFDKNGNGKLDPDEQAEALKWWQEHRGGQ